MSRFLALCGKELRLLARDRHGLLVLFVVPAAFILVMSLALRDAFDAGRHAGFPLHVANQDGAPLSRELAERLAALEGFAPAAAGDAAVTVTLLPGFSELLATRNDFVEDFLAGEPEPALLRIEYARTILPQVRSAAALAVRQAAQAVQTRYLLEVVLGYPAEQRARLAYLNDPRRLPVEERFAGAALAPPTSVQQNVPAWLIFAMFFCAIPLATTFVIERGQGSWLRLRALDVSPAALFAAKAAPYYLVNLAQMALMLAIGVWLVPALGGDRLALGGSVAGLWLIASATSLAAIGLALLVAIHVRTTTQATIAGGALALILAALGGVMVPKMVMPAGMQAATQVSPMSWALEGFWDVLLRGGGVAEVLPEAAALAALGVAALSLAGLRFRLAGGG